MNRVLLLVATSCGMAIPVRPLAAQTVDFQRDIRPILSNACFPCHGADEGNRKVDLRLDRRDSAFADLGEGRAAFVPGKPDQSEAYLRMTSSSPSKRMPPARSGKSLTPAQVQLIRRWIEEGARWSEHWAFVPPVRAPLPRLQTSGNPWPRNAIDLFILARLEKEGLRPSAEADPVTLLRRLSLDLTGLPPSIEEVDSFLADQAPDRYEKQVERLLASPHYGERWGRHWLDAARYADSDGYEKDKSRQVWAYREWVIHAFNRDLPYDRFLIEQIAGDLVPDGDASSVIATGFLRNSMINEEGGIDPEQFRMEAMYDRMDAIGKSILGLTIQCGQCHSHKFDPLTQAEYYGMFAFLNDSHEANIPVYRPMEQQERARILDRIAELEADLQHRHPDWPERLAAWEKRVATGQPSWTVVRPEVDDISTGGQKYLPQPDGSFLAQGYAPTKHRVKLTVRVAEPRITAFRLELLNHPDLPLGGPGRSIRGTCALTEFAVEEAAAAKAGDQPRKVKFSKARASISPPEAPLEPIFDDKSKKKRVTGPIDFAIDGKDETAWGIDAGPGRRNRSQQAVFVAEKPIENASGTILTFHLAQNHGGWNSDDNQNHNLGRFRLAITSADHAEADDLPPHVRSILAIPAERRTRAQMQTVFSHWRATVPEWQPVNDAIEALWRQHPEGSSQLVLQRQSTPRTTYLLARGDFLRPVRPVDPGTPAFLHPLPRNESPDRLAFARWLAARNSPTTARTFVNRVWQTYFGTGLVASSEDLGSQSEPPSHPELLDWLAVEFMDRGWSVKDLHRVLVGSATYRQSSRARPELEAKDPANRLLGRSPRLRVEAETVRDIALAAGGLLRREIGGPSVFPPAPEFLFVPPASYGPKVWPLDRDGRQYRRAMYTFSFRSVPYPALQVFDAPNGEFSCVRRARSNTPLQALTSLNEPVFVECAKALAALTIGGGGATDESRMVYAFRRCLSRPPSAAELQVLLDLLARQRQRSGGDEGAAWTAAARVLLNLDETMTKE